MAKQNEKLLKQEARFEKERGYLRMFTRVYVIFVLAIYPLYVGYEGYDNIVYSKAYAYWVFTVLFLIGFLLFYIPYILGKPKPTERVPFWKNLGFPDWAGLAFFTIVTLSCIFSEYQDTVWLGTHNRCDGWLTLFCMFAAGVVVSRWYAPSNMDFALFAISSIIVSVIAYLQFFGNDFMQLHPNAGAVDFGFYTGFRTTIGNIDFVSCYAAIAVIVFALLYVKTESTLRFLFMLASAMNFVLLIMAGPFEGKVAVVGSVVLLLPYLFTERQTFARFLIQLSLWGFGYVLHFWFWIYKFIPSIEGGYEFILRKSVFSELQLKELFAASAVALLSGLVLSHIKKWPNQKASRIFACGLIAAIIVVGLAGVQAIGPKLPETNIVRQAYEITHGNFQDEYGSWRIFTWKRALARIQYQPVLGTGADTFLHAFGKIAQSEARQTQGVIFDKAHNDFIQIIICFGIPGLLAYLALVCGIIALSVKKTFDDKFLLFALGGALAYIINGFFGIDTVIVTPIYWLLLGMIRSRQIESLTKE